MLFRILALLLALCVQQFVSADLVVDLDYAKYRGTDLQNGVARWAGMRYARSVSRVDGMRFAAPQDPLPERMGLVVDASKFGPTCIGSTSTIPNEFGGKESEDCLFVNVFAPTISASNTTTTVQNSTLLPVYVFIQGGGFNTNGNANYNGVKLLKASNNSMVIVNFNYRVGPYGFLASKEIADEKALSLNNGLKDQRQLLKWVQKHISKFGGDPNHVVLGGASAGAGSVVFQLTAYGGRDDKLFHGTAAESPAFPPLRNATTSQFMYDDLRNATGCQDLKCMREINAVDFQKAVRGLNKPFPGAKSAPLYFWNPTLDYDFIKDYTYNELRAGHFVKVPTIFGDDQNDGLSFTPSVLNSLLRTQQFLTDQFPNIDNNEDIKTIRRAWRGPVDANNDPRWRSVAADIYGHIRYTCPSLNASAEFTRRGASSWQYRWNFGSAMHVSELGPIWNNGTSPAGVFIQQYWVSFIKTLDPNNLTTTYYTANGPLTSPVWETYGTGNGKRMRFGNDDDVKMETISEDQKAKCDAIIKLGTQLAQ
ncbi:Alpha/Beta hydrolase protein [Dendryphion nanum]|uniref:Carboxylic ester hydrolase n=1 Tax=Dendryphion nanum TaxID=256645 RepID=A0A9P9IEP7_9PLEO|nr:Alpha/Beta hydrolase protein [Dendryphion nanum]